MNVSDFLERVDAVRKTGDGWLARCPSHEDHTPSLAVTEGRNGRAVVYCHAGCTIEAVCAALGMRVADLAGTNGDRPSNSIVAAYDYVDEAGELLYQQVRKAGKHFRQRRPDGNRGWVWKLGDTRRVLYRLPAVAEAVKTGLPVWICEGEKDVHALEDVGIVATTNPMGAGKWRKEYTESLAGVQGVVIVADRDDEGSKHAQQVAVAITDAVVDHITIVEAATGKDAHDHLAAGLGISDFVQVSTATGSFRSCRSNGSKETEETTATRRPLRGGVVVAVDDSLRTAKDSESQSPFAVTLGEFIDKPRPQVLALVNDTDGRPLIGRRSLVMVGARGGRGKTTNALDWIIHLALGRDYLCFTIPEAVRILIVENEGSEELFAEKLSNRVGHLAPGDQELVRERIHVYTFDWGGFNLGDDGEMQRLLGWLAQNPVDLIFGDPLDSLGIDGVGSPEDTRRFLGLMKQAGLNKTCAWWLNTHPRKEETREAIDEIAGAWGGKPDTIMLLDLLPDDRSRIRFPKIRWAKRGRRPSILLAYDADTATFSYLCDEEEEERVYEAEIMKLLADGKWRTVKEIGAPDKDGGIGAGETTIKTALTEHPDLFVSRTGREAVDVGRSSRATVWQLVEAHR
jgi:5S rRNA maturation endonuclease (ribonuclease M5)